MVSKLHNYSAAQLKARWDKLSGGLAQNIQEMAEINVALEGMRALEPRHLKGPMRWFREIASGRLAPEAAVAYCDGGRVSETIAKCFAAGVPLAEQKRLAMGGKLAFADHDAEGRAVRREKSLDVLPLRIIEIVLTADGKIRSFDEQARFVAGLPKAAKAARFPGTRTSVSPERLRYDPKNKHVICGHIRISVNDFAIVIAKDFEVTKRVKRAAA